MCCLLCSRSPTRVTRQWCCGSCDAVWGGDEAATRQHLCSLADLHGGAAGRSPGCLRRQHLEGPASRHHTCTASIPGDTYTTTVSACLASTYLHCQHAGGHVHYNGGRSRPEGRLTRGKQHEASRRRRSGIDDGSGAIRRRVTGHVLAVPWRA